MKNIQSLPLAKNKTQWLYIVLILFIIFFLNITYEFYKFKEFSHDEIYIANAKVINIYPKKYYQVLKLQTDDFVFFTSNKTKQKLKIQDNINLYVLTDKINFYNFLKGFYSPSFNIYKLPPIYTLKNSVSDNINLQHKNPTISNLFNALFFATPINKELRKICSTFGVSHLVAISGFHLGILSFIIYWLLYFPYSKIQGQYFPYRNKKFDLLFTTSILLFFYLIFTGIVPSLLRAFVMFVFGIYFLRTNIKIISFGTLALVVMFIIAFFPKLLFSLSLWFSVAGVFYIFLFIQYFKNLNKIVAFCLFNIWIYLSINPITHYFFGDTSLLQLYSPLFTVGFILFYPVELFLHLIGYGGLLDGFIEAWLSIKTETKIVFTPTWAFIGYLFISFLSIPCPKWFRTLNLSFIAFNLWLFLA